MAAMTLVPRKASEAGFGIDTYAVFDSHSKGKFHFAAADEPDVLETVRQLKAQRIVLWLGASQVFGINGYKPPERTVAYRVFDALIPDGVAVIAVTFPQASPQEHLISLQYMIGRFQISGLIVGAAFGDMRHNSVRPNVAGLLDDTPTREGLRAVGSPLATAPLGASQPAVAQPDRSASLAERSEAHLTRTLEDCCGFETFRQTGRAWILLGLQDTRRGIESLRARLTRDLSRYRVGMVERHYANNR
ncbi:MAG: hypothetical protein FJX62_08295 [Alphaproteobacteria bacterium]|nr:hypothetical protein [Alphaproteobacteria bacterium]